MATSGIDLKVQRVRAGVSQVALAERMKLHRATVARYEGLARVPDAIADDYLRALATLSDVGQKEAVA